MARANSAAETIYRLVRESVAMQDRIRMLEGRIDTLIGQKTDLGERIRSIEGHVLGLVRTNERLLKERQTLLEALGWQRLKDVGAPTRPLPPPVQIGGFSSQEDFDRACRELRALGPLRDRGRGDLSPAGEESFEQADLDRYYAELRAMQA